MPDNIEGLITLNIFIYIGTNLSLYKYGYFDKSLV